jgi:hypothetical protein
MACEIAGPEPSGLLLLGTLEIYCRDPQTDVTAKFHTAVATIDADMLQHAVACRRMHGGH